MAAGPILTFNGQKVEPAIRPNETVMLSVGLGPNLNCPRGTVLGEQLGTNSIQRLTITGGPGAGTFTITKDAVVSGAIPFGATTDVIRAAAEAMSSIGVGNILVRGGWDGAGGIFDFEFVGSRIGGPQTAITASVAGLTGGAPAQAVTQVQTGVAGNPGTFVPYVRTNTDGSQVAKAVLPYDCQTDSSGNITLSSTAGQAGGEFGQTSKSVEVYVKAFLYTSDLVGFDASLLEPTGPWTLVKGSPAGQAIVFLK